MLPTDAKDRKTYPITSGALDYFPDALAEIAHVSFVGNEQHNPGTPLHWDRTKSTDEADALVRHLLARGTRDTDGLRHSAKMAWRALALLQKEIEGGGDQRSSSPEPGAVVLEEDLPYGPQTFVYEGRPCNNRGHHFNYICTRRKGHGGPHHAHGVHGSRLPGDERDFVWPNTEDSRANRL